MFVAVVYTATPRRAEGSLECFIRATQEEAVSEALKHRERWESATRKYRVLVGELTGEAQQPTRFRIVPIDSAGRGITSAGRGITGPYAFANRHLSPLDDI